MPAFYGEWFMNRVRAGEAGYVNPYGGRKCAVSLRPEDTGFFVFWSKNFRPFLKYLDELDDMGFAFYFQFTITGHPALFEADVPPWRAAAETARELATRYSPEHVIWRFDPIIFSSITPPDYVETAFASIAASVAGATRRCFISYVDYYGKVQKNFESLAAETNVVFNVDAGLEEKMIARSSDSRGAFTFDLTKEQQVDFASRLAAIANQYDIQVYSCCEDFLTEYVTAIRKGHCVDAGLIAQLTDGEIAGLKPRPTREGCGCYESRDIGAYDTCPHGCVYCYANVNKRISAEKYAATLADSHSFALGRSSPRNEFPVLNDHRDV